MTPLEALVEIEAIKQLKARYIRFGDARQWGEFAATLTECPSSKHLAQVWRGVNGERASSGVGF